MADTLGQISALLHEAGETHHRVFRIVDGADDDWASWYAQWLIDLSELPDLLGARPVRSELTYLLVSLDKQYTAESPGEPWEIYYALPGCDCSSAPIRASSLPQLATSWPPARWSARSSPRSRTGCIREGP
jgi:hypothetical protein